MGESEKIMANTTINTTTLKNVDLFKADKTMSTRVEEYVKCRILRKAIMKQYGEQIKAIDASLENLKKLEGSILAENLPMKRSELLLAKEDIINKRNDQIAKEAVFTFTKADTTFKRTLKGLNLDSPKVAEAVVEWFKNYNLDVSDSVLLADILKAIGGKEDYDKLVDTDGLDGISVDNNKALSMLYWVAFKHMASVGTIKKAQIPDIIKDNFGTKAREAKKLAKKNAKTNK